MVFSGAAQFSMVSLLAGGTAPLAVVWAVAVLSLRHVALGAAIRPGLTGSRTSRLAAAWFVIDETVGLALASAGAPTSVLFRAGVACYGAWVLGTALGVAGGAVVGVESLAAAVFPVLFVGLASIMARGMGPVVRAVVAAGLTLVLLIAWPGLGGLAPVVAAVAVSVVGPAVTDLVVVVAAAVITYTSRAVAVVFLPPPTGRVAAFVSRLPAPLFAGLAVFALVGDSPAWPEAPALAAALAAVAVAPFRSVPVSLVAGLAAYGVVSLVW